MTDKLGWWSISGEALLDALRRVAHGDDPDVVYAELYANSDHERPAEPRYWWHHDDVAWGDHTGIPCAPTKGTAEGPSGACVGCGMRRMQWRRGDPIVDAP